MVLLFLLLMYNAVLVPAAHTSTDGREALSAVNCGAKHSPQLLLHSCPFGENLDFDASTPKMTQNRHRNNYFSENLRQNETSSLYVVDQDGSFILPQKWFLLLRQISVLFHF